MTILEQALDCHNGDNAALMIQTALNITDGDVAGYSLPRLENWAKMDREQRSRALAEWLANELRFSV